jgi:DNA polymerase-3 subunit epsilon
VTSPRLLAFDFETATRSRASACALGIAEFAENGVGTTRYWPIRPRSRSFDRRHVAIHGIDADQVRYAGNFSEVWDEVEPWLGGRILFAHNASFDIGVLTSAAAHYGIALPPLRYVDTLPLFRKGVGRSCSLKAVADRYGIEFRHHSAEEDARALASCVVGLVRERGCATVLELLDALDVEIINLGGADSDPLRALRAASQPTNLPDALSRLARQLREGRLTREEFAERKGRLLKDLLERG